MSRLQKDKDVASNEVDTLKDKVELLQSQLGKSQRDRDIVLKEVEDMQDKYDKAATQAQRMLVRSAYLLLHFSKSSLSSNNY